MTGPQKAALKQARQEAGDKADAEGLQRAAIDRSWTLAECEAYLLTGEWQPRISPPKYKRGFPRSAQGETFCIGAAVESMIKAFDAGGTAPTMVGQGFHEVVTMPEAVDQDAPPWVEDTPAGLQDQVRVPYCGGQLDYDAFHEATGKGKKAQREAQEAEKVTLKPKKLKPLANGRDSKGTPKFENWFGPVYPSDVAYPAWKALSKNETDVVNICRAKSSYSAGCVKWKDDDGKPIFNFSCGEAINTFKFTKTTFLTCIESLVESGFIERVVHGGGTSDGNGIKSIYRLCERWKTEQPETTSHASMDKARAALAEKRNAKK